MAALEALIFDQDGVLADTERDGHRVAFNQAFEEFGLPFSWDVPLYGELIHVGGGKERMRHYLHTKGFGAKVKPEEEDELIKAMHKKKTQTFIELIESGALPLRPGVRRIMEEAADLGLTLGGCTTSNERAARAIAVAALGDEVRAVFHQLPAFPQWRDRRMIEITLELTIDSKNIF